MKKIFYGVSELIGKTPMMRLNRYAAAQGISGAEIIAKLEYLNPAGSVKDRVGLALIEDAEKNGRLKPGAVVVEPTSGNTGVGLAAAAAVRGYRVILTMPDTMSLERRRLLAAYGAELVLTDGAAGMRGAVEKANEIAANTPGAFMPGQFANPANPKIHMETTGPEIWEDAGGKIDVFAAGVGTGGTITGVGGYLRKMNPAIHIIAVEPAESPVLSGGSAGPHEIQGVGAGFVPEVLDTSVYDEIVAVRGCDARATCHAIARTEGLLVGVSSGAAVWAAAQAAARPCNAGKTIVVLLPDSGERYLSTGLFD